MKTILPYGSGVPASAIEEADNDMAEDTLRASDSQLSVGKQWETSKVGNQAAEKHAFLHSHAGLEDVF